MKKSILKRLELSLAAVFAASVMIGCVNNTSNENEEISENKLGKTSVTMFIPDYSTFYVKNSSSRVVAPQTSSVKLGYNKGNGFIYLEPVNLSDAEKTSISEEASSIGIAGYSYTLEFSGIPCGSYESDTLEIQLLDSAGNAISKGTNSKKVDVVADSSAIASFYTIPVSDDAKSGSLSNGEMKFLKFSLDAESDGIVTILVDEGSSYPDVVVFYADGSFKEYVTLFEEKNYFTIEATQNAAVYYVGIWANGEDTSSYTITVSTKTESENQDTDDDEEVDKNEETSSLVAVIDGNEKSDEVSDTNKSTETAETRETGNTDETSDTDETNETEKVSESVELSPIVAGSYNINVASGYEKQDAKVATQIVNNIAVSAKIDDDYAVLKLISKEQQGTIKFTLDKAMQLEVTEVLGNRQTNFYGVMIVTTDGSATSEGENISLDSFNASKKPVNRIENKKISLTAGTYELGGYTSSKDSKVSTLVFTEIEE